jgi:D-sedoheptulose 7-phosphate isomerase
MNHVKQYFDEVQRIAASVDERAIEDIAQGLAILRKSGGRLFILGVGGSAGNASHATNDFRKLCGIETYAPTDNVPELTARTNDEGWETVFCSWLKTSRLSDDDAILIFSVGGGNRERNVSLNIVHALEYAKTVGSKIFGIVGRDGGYTKLVGDAVVVVPTVSEDRVTPHTEAFHGVVWHCLVSHPILQTNATKW